jgi:hypothetical protein
MRSDRCKTQNLMKKIYLNVKFVFVIRNFFKVHICLEATLRHHFIFSKSQKIDLCKSTVFYYGSRK